jgi:hypothetical protein
MATGLVSSVHVNEDNKASENLGISSKVQRHIRGGELERTPTLPKHGDQGNKVSIAIPGNRLGNQFLALTPVNVCCSRSPALQNVLRKLNLWLVSRNSCRFGFTLQRLPASAS